MSHADDGTLHAYLDGELTAAERTGLEAHLAACPACQARLAEERELMERAQGLLARVALPEIAVPPMRRAGSGRSGPRPLPRWVPLAWAASVLLALGGGWMARGGRVAAPEAAPVAAFDALAAVHGDSAPGEDAPANVALDQRDAVGPVERNAPAAASGRRALEAKAAPAEEGPARVGGVVVTPREDRFAAADQAARGAAAPPAPVGQAVAPRTEAAQLAPTVVTANADERATLPAVTVDSARVILGVEPVTIPGVAVRRIGIDGPGVVVVEQALDARTVVRLYQRRAEAMREGQEAMARQRSAAQQRPTEATERLARYVGSLRVEITGPVGADSLSKLLGRVR